MLDTVFNILKVTAIIAVASIFLAAILAFAELIANVVFGNVVGEVLGIISMCLPFNASIVFGSIGVSVAAILSFMIANKIFGLTSWSISSV